MNTEDPRFNQGQTPGKEAPLLSLKHVTKGFGGRPVINDVTMDFNAGVFAVTGPNGCGKSTLLAVMAGILPADTGEVFFSGVSSARYEKRVKSLLAYLPDTPCIYPFLTGTEFLNLVFGIRRVADFDSCLNALSAFELQAYLDTRFTDMSLGTQRKFMLVSVLAPPCQVLLLDEPGNALDSSSREYLIDTLKSRRANHCVILADHDQQLLRETQALRLGFESGRLICAPESAE